MLHYTTRPHDCKPDAVPLCWTYILWDFSHVVLTLQPQWNFHYNSTSSHQQNLFTPPWQCLDTECWRDFISHWSISCRLISAKKQKQWKTSHVRHRARNHRECVVPQVHVLQIHINSTRKTTVSSFAQARVILQMGDKLKEKPI